MKLAKVPEGRVVEMLSEFCNTSCFTFEGIDLSDKSEVNDFKKKLEVILRSTGFKEKECIGYIFTGKMMNETYSLTGDNAYKDDLTFLAIPNYYNPMMKIKLGARWMDDIVANNAIRQNAEYFGQEPDYD